MVSFQLKSENFDQTFRFSTNAKSFALPVRMIRRHEVCDAILFQCIHQHHNFFDIFVRQNAA